MIRCVPDTDPAVPEAMFGPVLNEVSCRGDDWIEIAVLGDDCYDLSGWRLSDRRGRPEVDQATIPPGTILCPGEHLVLYEHRDLPFGIACGDEEPVLLTADGAEISHLMPPVLHEGQTWGILPGTYGVPGILRPTAGQPNEATPRHTLETVGPTEPGPTPAGVGPCDIVNARLGGLVCRNTSVTPADLEFLTVDEAFLTRVTRIGKYTVPADVDPILLPRMLHNVSRYPLHEEFLGAAFPELFGTLTGEAYTDLVARRATRSYFTGSVFLLDEPGSAGFSIVTDPAAPEELPREEEATLIAQEIRQLTGIDDVGFLPMNLTEAELASDWSGAMPVLSFEEGGAPSSYQMVTPGTCYGTVRLFTIASLEAALAEGQVGWRDIVVLDDAPTDLRTVVSGIVTGQPQTELSHLAIRTSRRGTPNCHQVDAPTLFEPLVGTLIRLQVFPTGYLVNEDVEMDEAEAFWAEHRPSASIPDPPDLTTPEMPGLAEVDLSSPEARRVARSCFGSKGTGLALLHQKAGLPHPVDGFLIPFSWYHRFMTENSLEFNGIETTYLAHLQALMSDDEFRGDPAYRKAALDWFQETAKEQGDVPDAFLAAIRTRVVELFGADDVMVRMRSSSNAEDILSFSGAGLYRSRSACAADSFDEDDDLPSRCDANTGKERPLRDALIDVWTSLWSFEAVEERDYYQINPDDVAMGVLVSPRFIHEDANGVMSIFETNDGTFEALINAQWGAVSVVYPEPGIQAERTALTWTAEGQWSAQRLSRSTLLDEAFVVLPSSYLEQLAVAGRAIMDEVRMHFPIEAEAQVMFDVEWKFDKEGLLKLKQVRPQLKPEIPEPDGLLLATVAPLELCSTFIDHREILREWELRSKLRLQPLQRLLPFEPSAYPIVASWGEDLRIGPDEETAVPSGMGEFTLEVTRSWQDVWTFRFRQAFESSHGEVFMEWTHFVYSVPGEPPEGKFLNVDDGFEGIRVCLDDCIDPDQRIEYRSCAMNDLQTWDRRYSIADGEFPFELIQVETKHRVEIVESGPLRLRVAELTEREDGTLRRVEEFFDMAYASKRHNESEDFLFKVTGGPWNQHFILVDEPDEWANPMVTVSLLDEDLQLVLQTSTDDISELRRERERP
jgi:hypothetical protein